MADGTDTTRTVKRRGILAAAGAVVAGIVAKQAGQPVEAATNGPLLIGTFDSPSNATDITYLINPTTALGIAYQVLDNGSVISRRPQHRVLPSLATQVGAGPPARGRDRYVDRGPRSIRPRLRPLRHQ